MSISLHNLKPAEGSTKTRKRVGRGQGSGSGGTAGKGHKGAKSRSGYKSKRGFEGGQMPLQRRTPKRGFKNPFKEIYQVINLAKLQEIADKNNITEFNYEVFRTLKIISKTEKIKVLGNGELKANITIAAHAFSDKAKETIEKLGGKTTVI